MRWLARLTDSTGSGDRGAAARGRHRAGLQDGGHLRGGVRRRHAVLLHDLRGRERGGAAARAEGGRHRQRPDPHRPGNRVRLLLRAGGACAARGGRARDHDQQQPRDGQHRLRYLRPPLLRAARRGGRAGHPLPRGGGDALPPRPPSRTREGGENAAGAGLLVAASVGASATTATVAASAVARMAASAAILPSRVGRGWGWASHYPARHPPVRRADGDQSRRAAGGARRADSRLRAGGD